MSLFRDFEKIAKTQREKIAIISRENKITFGNVLEMVNRFDLSLRQHISPGRKRIAFASNRPELHVIMMLVASRNSHTVLFSTPGTLDDCGIEFDFFLTDHEPTNGNMDKRIKIDKSWFARQKTRFPADYQFDEGEAVFAEATSGSTGRPMLYPTKDATWVTGLKIPLEFHDIQPFDTRTFCSTSPATRWSHNLIFMSLLRGGSIFSATSKEEYLPHLIDLYQVNFLAITPAFATKLFAVDKMSQYLQGVKKIMIGGAFVSPNLLQRLADISPASISVVLGATENNAVTAYTYDPDVSHPDGYVGDIIDPDFDVVFFDPETRERIDGNEGLVGIRHPISALATPYLNTKGDLREEAFREGYFLSGDLMRREGDSLFHLGRSSNIVNIGGNKFSIDRIEQILAKIPEIGIVSAFSQTEEDGIEGLCVAYTASTDLSLEDMNTLLHSKIKFAKISQAKRFRTMPLNAATKVDKAKVKEIFFS